MRQTELTINDVYGILKRRVVFFVIPFLLISILSVITAFILKPVYRSTATILIEEQDIPADFVVTTVTSYVEQRLQTINQRIMSTDRLMAIIKRFNLYEDKRKKLTTGEIIDTMREDVVLELISADVVDKRTGRTTTATIAFSLSYVAKESPEVVQKVASQLTSLFLEENLQVRKKKTSDTSKFLKDESTRVKNQLDKTEAAIAIFKKDHINELPEMLQLNLQELSNNERNIERLQENLRSLKEREGYLKAELSTTSPEWHKTWVVDKDENVKRMEFLEVQLISLETRYSDQHPDVIKTKEELKEIWSQLEAAGIKYEKKKNTDQKKPENPAYISLSAQLSGVQAEIETIERMIANLESSALVYKQRIVKTPAVEEQYNSLLSQQANSRVKYNDLLQKYMEAEIAQGLEKEQKGERFTLIDAPRMPEKPYKPNRVAIIIFGIILGACSGFALVSVKEFSDRSVLDGEKLSVLTRQTVLATIPEIKTDSDLENEKKKKWIKIGCTAVVLIVALLVFHFFIMDFDVFWARITRGLAF